MRSDNEIVFDRVTDRSLLKEVGDDHEALFFAVGCTAMVNFYTPHGRSSESSQIRVGGISGGSAEKKTNAHIEVLNDIEFDPPQPHRRHTVKATIDPTVGERVPLVRNYSFVVKRIVAPDEKRKISGWIELEPAYTTAEK